VRRHIEFKGGRGKMGERTDRRGLRLSKRVRDQEGAGSVFIRRPIAMGVALILGASALVACGGGEEAAPTDTGADVRKVERVAMLIPGRKDDQGYSQIGFTGLQNAAQKFGFETALAEAVDVSAQVEVYRDFASRGFDLVIGWGGQYQDGADEVAPEFPDTSFLVVNGIGGNGSNVASIDLSGEQWTFLAGYVAGKVTKTGIIGIVANGCFDSVARQNHGFRDGAKFANPDVKVLITAIESFDDPAGAKEAALAQIAQGADVIEAGLNTGNLGVYEATEENAEKPVFATTEYTDQHDLAPKTFLTSSLRDLSVVVAQAVDSIESGTFKGEAIRIGITAEDEALARFRGKAPDSLYEEAKEIQAKIVSGEIEVVPDGSCPMKG
jgi:basic membrane protein A